MSLHFRFATTLACYPEMRHLDRPVDMWVIFKVVKTPILRQQIKALVHRAPLSVGDTTGHSNRFESGPTALAKRRFAPGTILRVLRKTTFTHETVKKPQSNLGLLSFLERKAISNRRKHAYQGH